MIKLKSKLSRKRLIGYGSGILLALVLGNLLLFIGPFLPGYYRYLTYQEPVLEYPGAEIVSHQEIGIDIELVMRTTDSRETIAAYYTEFLDSQGWNKDFDSPLGQEFVYPAVYFRSRYIIKTNIYQILIDFETENDITEIKLRRVSNLYIM